ncbi:hypothetical protein N7481_004292 [Penicillium waksmanii]|uniref:uncharacterized protein n=1 Tax=Penicillium waksmanii TaxID=69791 RepID=UPI002547909E|nr:uncharacterized protein N7481_004292 [Penicillium waksmanii]KAJ5989082.1 hypothetical protein N7481_004292 [Penicillium waksmanii]
MTLDLGGADLASVETFEALTLALTEPLICTLAFTLALSTWDSGSGRSWDGGAGKARLAAEATTKATASGARGNTGGRTSRSRGVIAVATRALVATTNAADTPGRAVRRTARFGSTRRRSTGGDGARRTLTTTLKSSRRLGAGRSTAMVTMVTVVAKSTTRGSSGSTTGGSPAAKSTARSSTTWESAGGLNAA